MSDIEDVLARPCVICEQVAPKEQIVFNINRGAVHILCLTKEMSNEDDVTTAFTDHEFTETSEKPIEMETPTEGLKEYSDTMAVDEGEYSNSKANNTGSYANDEAPKEAKKDVLKKPYGKLGMYKDALNYDFEDEDEQQNNNQYVVSEHEKTDTPTPTPNTNDAYHNDVLSDDEDTKTPEPKKLGGYYNDNEEHSEDDGKDVNLDQGSYMQQPMDDMLGLGSPVLRQMSVPKISLGYHDNKIHSDNSGGGKIRPSPRSKIESYVETFSDSESEDESGSFESLRNSAEAIQPPKSNIDPNHRDWNTEYQEILSIPEDNERDRLERQMRLINIIGEFKVAVERIGKVIITESNKLPEDKTYKPLASKGIAGGQKYIVENLFFKLSIDNKGLYGADEFSRKVANIELLGLKGYIKCQPQVPNLRTPLLARVDFMGYRLLAMCVLPIGSNTLVYGSDDGGRTVNIVDASVNKMMEKAGRLLNLQPHKVSPEKKTVWAAADVEVHKGYDGRYYVLDTARVFPPECPYREVTAIKLDPLNPDQSQLVATKIDVEQTDLQEILGTNMTSESLSEGTLFYDETDESVVNLLASGLAGKRIFGKAYLIYGLDARFLFYQLRPELVTHYKKPLNPDAFTNFTRFDENYKAHNVAVLEATNHLRQVVINKLAHDMLSDAPYVHSAKMLKETMHKYGVNIRYLGLLRSLTFGSTRLQSLILFEMICRCVKNFLARKLRKFNDRHESAITKYLNILLGNSKASEFYWCQIIKVQIEAKFGQYGPSLKTDELFTSTNLRKDISKYLLFQAICKAVGIKYKLDVLKAIQNNSHFFDADFPFTEDMIESIEPRATIATTVPVENPDIRQSLEKARHLISEAMLCFNGKQYDEAYDMLQEAKRVLSAYQVVPVELAAKLLFIEGNIHLARKSFDAAEESFSASLYAISKVFGGDCIRDFREKERNKERSFPLSTMLIINNLDAAAEITLRAQNYRAWSYLFHCLWISSKCPLTKPARRMIFGVEVPKPLIAAVSAGKKIEWVENEFKVVDIPFTMPPETEHQFDLYHPISQAWINKLMAFEENSGINLYINWTDEEEMKLFNVPPLFGRIDVPCFVDPTQPIKISYNLPDDVSLYNSKIVAAIRSEGYWNYLHHDFLWQPNLETCKGEIFIPSDVWNRVPADDRFLIVGFFDCLSSCWYFPPTYVVPFDHNHTFALSFDQWRTNTVDGLMNGFAHVIPMFPQASEIRVKKMVERNNVIVAGISETGKAFTWLNQRADDFGSKREYREGALIEGLVGKEIVDIEVNRPQLEPKFVDDNTFLTPADFTVALTKKGLLFTWGMGAEGVLGLGFSNFLEINPRVVRSLQNTVVIKVACGHRFIVAISKTGHVFVWGKIGQRNVGTYPQLISVSPDVANFTFKESELIDNPVVDVACGPEHAIMLSNRGSFYYLGQTYPDGGFFVNKKIVLPNIRIVQIASGAKHILLLGDNNKLYAFGSNLEGELGTFSDVLPFPDLEEPFNQIREVKFNSTIFQVEPQILKISAEYTFSVALSKDHELFVWGNGFPYPVSLKPSLQRYHIDAKNFVIGGNMSILLPDQPYEENKMLEALRDEQLEGYVPTPRRNNAPNVQEHGNNNNNNAVVPLEDYLELKQRLEKLEALVAQLAKK